MNAKTTRDLAERHQVSQRTVQRWLKEGKIAPEGHQTPGGHWRAGRKPTLADLPPEIGAAVRLALAKWLLRLAELLGVEEEQR